MQSIGTHALERRPHFASLIGHLISAWSHVEGELGLLFGALVGLESDAAQRVFALIRRASNQRDAVSAAAEARLSGADLELVRALLVEHRALEGYRNSVAHSVFGVCEDEN